MGKVYRVYRLDFETQRKIPIGTVQERRNPSRPANMTGLMKLAQKIYAQTPEDQMMIFLGEELRA